jgi:hypothetical protein
MQGLAEILERVRKRGYTEPLEVRGHKLFATDTGLEVENVTLADTLFSDNGTDPGDDVTVYLLKVGADARGYLLMPDGPHADPATASFIDRLMDSRNK